MIIEKMGQSFSIFRIDGDNFCAELWGTHVNDFQLAGEGSPSIKFYPELEHIAALHEQTAFQTDAGFADVDYLAGRRERTALQPADTSDIDTRMLTLEPHCRSPYVRHHNKRNDQAKAITEMLRVSLPPTPVAAPFAVG